jgi:hypothetical protein
MDAGSLRPMIYPTVAMLLCAVSCVDGGGAAELPASTAVQATTTGFQCLNHTSIHVLTCDGSISLFPITITIENLRILSDNDISILSNDLNDIAIHDGNVVDGAQILNDVETRLIEDFANQLGIALTRNDITVCIAGTQICR